MANRPTIAGIIQIGDTWLPGICDYNYTLEDIDSENSKRAEDGTMHREVLRPNVYHANVSHYCTLDEVTTVCGLIKEDTSVEINAFCPGKNDGAYATMTVYVSKVTSKLIWYEDPESGLESWWQIDYQLVEV